MKRLSLNFIDLFAGLGGFHLALKDFGYECVYACEIDPQLNALYEQNFGFAPAFDIREIDIDEDIQDHDILCAGFPCQPFSQANHGGKGFECPKWGNLFYYVIDILRAKKPRYFILENVPYLVKQNGGETWQTMRDQLETVGYTVNKKCFSPHEFGIPQVRQRLFIVGNRQGPAHFPEPPLLRYKPNIRDILDDEWTEEWNLPELQDKCLNVWQNFLDLFRADEEFPPTPFWSREFGATYPYKKTTPYALGVNELRKYLGNHGIPLANLTDDEVWQNLPAYAKRQEQKFPPWKIHYIEQNRRFYDTYKSRIDKWLPQISEFPPTYQRFEWNCKGMKRNIWDLLIQFRGSGVRVRKPETAPTLVVRSTQVPIIGWQKRYMTPQECARLQSIEGIKLPQLSSRALSALGNAVNVKIVKLIVKELTSDTVTRSRWQKQLDLPINTGVGSYVQPAKY